MNVLRFTKARRPEIPLEIYGEIPGLLDKIRDSDPNIAQEGAQLIADTIGLANNSTFQDLTYTLVEKASEIRKGTATLNDGQQIVNEMTSFAKSRNLHKDTLHFALTTLMTIFRPYLPKE